MTASGFSPPAECGPSFGALYHHLIPSNKKGLQKPLLIHCGYIAKEEFLFAYTRRYGQLQECPGNYEGEIILLKLDTMYAAVNAIMAELKFFSIRPHLPYDIENGGGTRIVAFYNNYSMNTILLAEAVEKLAQFLGKEQEQPI